MLWTQFLNGGWIDLKGHFHRGQQDGSPLACYPPI